MVQTEGAIEINRDTYEQLAFQDHTLDDHPIIRYYDSAIETQRSQIAIEKYKTLPEIKVTAFQGVNSISNFKWYPGVQAGIGIPLSKQSSKVREEAIVQKVEIQKIDQEQQMTLLQAKSQQLKSSIGNYQKSIDEYKKKGLPVSQELMSAAGKALNGGEIDQSQYIQSMDKALRIQLNYLDLLHGYNQTVIQLNHLIN